MSIVLWLKNPALKQSYDFHNSFKFSPEVLEKVLILQYCEYYFSLFLKGHFFLFFEKCPGVERRYGIRSELKFGMFLYLSQFLPLENGDGNTNLLDYC